MELGLKRHLGNYTSCKESYYLADDIHKLLGEGEEYFWTPYCDAGMKRQPWHTHQALGIGIRPIRPQTLEDLVREFLLNRENSHLYAIEVSVNAFCAKAREILEGDK